ncbi:nephrin-like isoform X2 [Oratosquilla oratoria]|uniref:nephrin-like isoform X2 n=1 Tax=Oratosquilla oratoria TaxID=337810 RepID=UPI003F767F2B
MQNDVICKSYGAWPLARVIWMQDGEVVDSNYTEAENMTYNTLEVRASRKDLTSPFECRASNNDQTPPKTATFTRNVTCEPLSVKITTGEEPLVEGREVKITCTVIGSNPPALVTWYLQGKQVEPLHTHVSERDNITISVLTMTITRSYNERQLVCRAANKRLPQRPLEDLIKLNVLYKPNATLLLGKSLNASLLQERNDVYFECKIKSNPPPYKVEWFHNGELVTHNKTAGVLVSESLVLQNVTLDKSGWYQCRASNVEGDAQSNVVNITIKYAPRCAVDPALRGVGFFEHLNVTCVVDADPPNVSFTWTFNNSVRNEQGQDISSNRFSQDGLSSTLLYVPMTERDYGTLLCYASNSVGHQKVPCSFTVISAGPPEQVSNCTSYNVTSHSASVACSPGFNGGLPQRFRLQVWSMETLELVLNYTSEEPVFDVRPLAPGMSYKAAVTAFNSRGSSQRSVITILTINEAKMHMSLPSRVEPSPLMLVLGVMGGVLLVVITLLLVVWRLRKRGRQGELELQHSSLAEMQKRENNPDLIKDDCRLTVTTEPSTNILSMPTIKSRP